jgi:hypothetical protein
MVCPFLSDAVVRGCGAAPLHKLISGPQARQADEKCGTAHHVECAVFRERGGEPGAECPYREERPVQYCSASQIRTYVPYSTPEATRCGTEAYADCEAYRAVAGPVSDSWTKER